MPSNVSVVRDGRWSGGCHGCHVTTLAKSRFFGSGSIILSEGPTIEPRKPFRRASAGA